MIAFFEWLNQVKGELAALGAAGLWASASVIYERVGEKIPPLHLNLVKGIIASVFLVITFLIQGQTLPVLEPFAFWMLVFSGVIGIAVADTALFAAFNFLGARRTLLFKVLTAPTVAVIAMIFLQEKLTAIAWCGIVLTLTGVAWVISERVADTATKGRFLVIGIGWATVSTLGDASAAVLSRAALAQNSIDPLWSTFVRLNSGSLVLLLWMLWQKSAIKLQVLKSKNLFLVIALTAFFSTYLGIWLQQVSLKFAAAGITQTLSATSPLFIIPIAYWLGEKISLRAILGVLIALSGVALLFGVK
ncbi:MAG: DMT family transporter [Oscillatoriaceae bacterium SKW80]|nr:DMT family transporter [Oscillatoriaceae bacterium SKYG93]MCX8121089.1 DMT family transporter [Oscillatoriaceae bacterium SKW80]MDW8453581.1 DMT family transporter [Oscillatoriaceae cyanobacterium SKYGB_i_bin93]HIK26932.1 DMT family transporter [Oscillatoriaceae cyanobacterium M7585_C2015_266]